MVLLATILNTHYPTDGSLSVSPSQALIVPKDQQPLLPRLTPPLYSRGCRFGFLILDLLIPAFYL